ncbi:MAG TPA: heavy metal translocating P-type ATPase [Candidatus Azoamicus sp. OHIO1]
MIHVKNCFHCGLLIKSDCEFKIEINKVLRFMCCPGCLAVAEFILENNLNEYYSYREKPSPSIKESYFEDLKSFDIHDESEIQKDFINIKNNKIASVILLIDGISCAACTWLIERHLKNIRGIKIISLNLITRKAKIEWYIEELTLNLILKEIKKIGYSASPYTLKKQEKQYTEESKRLLKKLIVAGIGMMQVMMLAIALYMGKKMDMIESYKIFIRWISLIITTPILIYSAENIFYNAYKNLKMATLGMDVPIALSLLIAYFSSIYNMQYNLDHVYFDSISMFIFFLLIAKFLEMRARHNSSKIIHSLQKLSTGTATLINNINHINKQKKIKIDHLKYGDFILVKPGEIIPLDGIIKDGNGVIDESMLTGESKPVYKKSGMNVIGGTNNIDNILIIKVTKTKKKSKIASIIELLEQANLARPKITNTINKIAKYFVLATLSITTFVTIIWIYFGKDNILEITLSMLVVTCPCALSLATPMAITSCTNLLAKSGFLITKEHVLETLNNITDVVFDKTGTLTINNFYLKNIIVNNISIHESFSIALALEKNSHHPIAKAFTRHTLVKNSSNFLQKNVKNFPNQGIQGEINGQEYRIGKLQFIKDWITNKEINIIGKNGIWIVLANKNEILTWFNLTNPIRKQAYKCINELKLLGVNLHILSGDSSNDVEKVSRKLRINNTKKNFTVEDKVLYIKKLQNIGLIVMMVGDGINDAPALNISHVSTSMGSGTDLAKINSDSVLLNNNLSIISDAIKNAKKTTNVIVQNIIWALAYNTVGLVTAGLGLIEPYYAAIGMSMSSLLVIFNSKKLEKN